MKVKIIKLLTILGIVCCHHAVLAQETRFVGKWKIVPDRSDFGGLEQNIAAPSTIDLTLIADTIKVRRKFGEKEDRGEDLVPGAKYVEVISSNGNILRKSKFNWSKDKKQILFDWIFEVDGNDSHYTRNEIWNLSEDGKTLTVDRITTLPEKTDKVKAVYQKQ